MSLLMEALKKAEEAKRLASEAPASEPAAESSQNPATQSSRRPNTLRGSPLPDLSLHIDSVDADLAAVSTTAPAPRRAPAVATNPPDDNSREGLERLAARNVFAAKQVPRAQTGLWLFLGLSGIVVLGFCIYFWWQLRAVSADSLTRPTQSPLPAQTMPPALTTQKSESPAVRTTQALPEPPKPAETPVLQTSPVPRPPVAPTSSRQKPLPAAAPTAPDGPVQLSQSQPKPNQALERAYNALQAGRLDDAQRGYEQVLRSDGKNIDALLGLATISARQGQSEWAQAYYLRALESDPNDATAQAGLINIRGDANPSAAESRLKTALIGQPDSPPLHFALGNLYARQERWSEAQQAYFRAYSTEPENADFIFNLAVSLDHLHQKKLAAQFYQMALNAAGVTGVSFDKNQVKARLIDLNP